MFLYVYIVLKGRSLKLSQNFDSKFHDVHTLVEGLPEKHRHHSGHSPDQLELLFLHLNCQLRWKDIICYIFPARLCKRLDDAPENHWSQRQVMHVMQHSCGYELTTCTRGCHLQLRISGTTTGWKDELGV